jgi:hypothetical protein
MSTLTKLKVGDCKGLLLAAAAYGEGDFSLVAALVFDSNGGFVRAIRVRVGRGVGDEFAVFTDLEFAVALEGPFVWGATRHFWGDVKNLRESAINEERVVVYGYFFGSDTAALIALDGISDGASLAAILVGKNDGDFFSTVGDEFGRCPNIYVI